MASACALARQRLVDFVGRLEPAGLADKGGSAIKASMLAGVSAPLKGVAGNLTWGGFKVLAQQPVEAAFDYVQALGRSIASGGTVKPHELREVVNALDVDGMLQYGAGFKAGAGLLRQGHRAGRAAQRALPPGSSFGEKIAAYMDEIQTVLNVDAASLSVNTPTQVRIKNPAARAMVEAGFAAVEAVDRPFFRAAHQMSLYMQAKLAGVRQGLKADALKAEIDRLMAGPTDEMLTRAQADAMYATFKDKPAMVRYLENGKRALLQIANDTKSDASQKLGASIASLSLDLTIPFTGVPTSIAAKGASLTPLGLLSPKLVAGTQAQRSRALANVTLGTTLMGIGYVLAKEGQLEGTPSANKNEREDVQATRQPQAIRVGDQWLRVTDVFGPLAAPLMAGAALARQAQTEPDAGMADQAVAIAGAVGKNTVETSFMQGTKRLIDAVSDPEGRGEAFAAGLLAPVVPAVVGQVSRAIDPTDREATSITDRLLNRTPFRSRLPARGTPFGPQPEPTLAERLNPFSPARVAPDRSTPETEELRRLGVTVGTRPRMLRGEGGAETPMDDATYADVLARREATVLPTIRRIMADPGYARLSDVEKREVLQRVVRDTKAYSDAPARAAQRLLR